MNDYPGKILEVNLSTQSISSREVGPDLIRQYLGGIGFNARILYDEIPAGTDPLGEENVLAFAAGTLVGTPFPTASRTEASAKSPLSGQFGTSNSGAFFGTQLKTAGYDALIVKGKSARPVYIVIDDGDVQILDAAFIWGKECWETVDILEHKHYGAEVALIGPAGENLVRFASIENGRYDGWGRTGLGAVMGSKNLKAITVKGSRGRKVHDRAAMLEAVRKGQQLIKSASSYIAFTEYGTLNASIPYGKFKATSAHNFTKGTLPDWKDIGGRSIVDKYGSRHVACQSCIIACGHWAEIKEGKYAGVKVKDLEITPVMSFGATVGLDTEAIIKASEICQRYGVDMVSAGGVLGFAIELYKKGVITDDDVGFELDFGDDEAAFKLLQQIINREGIGDILAEGTKRAAERFANADRYAIHIKGMELPFIDPRGRWSTWTLGMLTNIRGGDHLRCRNPVENLRYNDKDEEYMKERFGFKKPMYDRLDMPEDLKSKAIDLENDTVDIAEMSKWAEDLINLYNSVGICIRPPVMEKVGPTIIAEACRAFIGLDVSAADLMESSERTWNLIKLFNLREGEEVDASKFPRRFYEEDIDGNILDEEKIQGVLEKYYQVRGWDGKTGKPADDTLTRLNLNGEMV
ncbi:tungsten-containing aldehyde:ferredoxin oxidoreductase [hydrocarbon metagenome]|uniref:Tungsten-containing aldehyde:ferredoxin oxidoreductase n=1 Tax=hydrocarbon metagenome TaxID=938273 RepID=A0A0W8E3B3_9ZZZZ